MRRTFVPAVITGLFTLFSSLVLTSAGCSSTTTEACDSSKCLPGNACLTDGTEVKCRRPCATQSDCPFNYHCASYDPKPFCVADKTAYTKAASGQWGARCLPGGDSACDTDQGFFCYGTSPSDGSAFCTQFDCTSDSDCKGGYWCATVNAAPNAVDAKRSVGETRKVCVPRDYCSPCATDVDCPSVGGAAGHCVNDSAGNLYCATECQKDNNCVAQAACTDVGIGVKVCAPRAGACVGDGSICSPCRSDADCPAGVCARSGYSTETFCTVKSETPCNVVGGKLQGAKCPGSPISGVKIGCQPDNTDPYIPKDQCMGLVPLGVGTDGETIVPGCWTPAR